MPCTIHPVEASHIRQESIEEFRVLRAEGSQSSRVIFDLRLPIRVPPPDRLPPCIPGVVSSVFRLPPRFLPHAVPGTPQAPSIGLRSPPLFHSLPQLHPS